MQSLMFPMKRNIQDSILLKGSEVVRLLGLGATAGYRYLKHLEKEAILLPVRLPGMQAPRYKREEIEALANNKEVIPCEEFLVNK